MVNVLVTGGAGFIGSNFVRYAHRRARRLARHDARQADLRRPAGEPARASSNHPTARRSSRATSPTRRSPAPLVAAGGHRRALRRRDARRSLDCERRRVHHDRRLSARSCCSKRRGRTPKLRRFVQISTDEVYGSVAEGASTRDRRAAAAQSLLGQQGRRGSPGLQLLGDLPGAGRSSPAPRTTTVRTSFPRRSFRSSSPTRIDDMPGAAVRRRPERARLAARRPIIAARVDLLIDEACNGEVYNIGGGNHVKNIDLTRRILELVGRPDSLISPVADRPGHDRRYSLDCAKLQALGWRPRVPFERGLAETVALVPGQRVLVAARSRTRIRRSASTTRSSTARRGPDTPSWLRLPLITGATGFAGSHLLDAIRQDGGRAHAWCNPDGRPPDRRRFGGPVVAG